MENFNLGWGSIQYRTTLSANANEQILKITEVHDYAQVFIDGVKISTLNRLKDDNKVLIPAVKESAVLDILVEAMGRRNFGEGIYDRKGITEKVELGDVELKNWKVYLFPSDNKPYKFLKPVRFNGLTILVCLPVASMVIRHPLRFNKSSIYGIVIILSDFPLHSI